MPHRVLILGGTTEARRLAATLVAESTSGVTSPDTSPPDTSPPDTSSPDTSPPSTSPIPSPTRELGGASRAAGYDNSAPPSTERYAVVSSLAGRTSKPLEIAGDVRVGGFGGVAGLVRYLTDERIDVVVDATHPFAATMTGHAVEAATRAGVPVLVLRRPGWVEVPGDDWRRVRNLAEAAARLPGLGERVFLTTGRQSIAAFAGVDGCWFLSRSVEEPAGPRPKRLEVVLDRGPFTLDGERRLMRRHGIEVLVTKDSGGPAPKLAAARELGLPVLMVDRPPVPDAPTAAGVEEAVEWLGRTLPGAAGR